MQRREGNVRRMVQAERTTCTKYQDGASRVPARKREKAHAAGMGRMSRIVESGFGEGRNWGPNNSEHCGLC